MDLMFEWDQRKDQTNLEKHGIPFTEATAVFGDPLERIFADEDHSGEEEREIILGHSRARRLRLVCFTEREDGQVRIIRARRATRREPRDYEEHIRP